MRHQLLWNRAAQLAVSCFALNLTPGFAVTQQTQVIYGEDHRLDVFAAGQLPEMVKNAKATALMTSKNAVESAIDDSGLLGEASADTVTLPAVSYGDSLSLCETERFREQSLAGFCSTFLVAPNVLVTAGHCVTSQFDCDNAAFVFDYAYLESSSVPHLVKKSNIYSCKSVIKTELNPENGNDFAIIELDRNVTDRTPLAFRKSGKVSDNAPLTVIGNPSGLPTKIAPGANVRDNDGEHSFVANLDTYQGNSGSAVFHSDSGVIEGILVRGEDDFELDLDAGCRKSKLCADDECSGETVTRATEFAPFVAEFLSRDH